MRKRVPNLDLLRFIAIVSVIYYHLGERYLPDLIPNHKIFGVGKFGVELFFVLSGFLITNIYYSKKNIKNSLITFWLQRFLRTYPPYLVALLISFLGVYIFKKQNIDVGYFFLVQNFYYRIPFFLVSWSLCIEEHFYLFFPLVIILSERIFKMKKFTLMIWVVIVLAPTFLRYYYGDFSKGEFGYFRTATIFRFDAIASGCLFAYIINNFNFELYLKKYIPIVFGLAFLLISYWMCNIDSQIKYSIGYFVLVFFACLWLIAFYYSDSFYLSNQPFIKNVAGMAYSLYLTHAIVLNIFEKIEVKSNVSKVISIPICLGCIFFVGFLFNKLFEKPSIKMRDYLLHKVN